MTMTPLKLCLATITVVSCVSGESVVQQKKPTSVLHPSGANFREAPGRVRFSPDGKLYVAYRVPEREGTSSTLRVMGYDPMTGQQSRTNDYPLPVVSLPRVPTDFILSRDGSTLAYAELHDPQVIVTIDATTLKPLNTSVARMFGEQDFAPNVAEVNSQSLVLSAGKLTHDGKVTTVHHVRKLTLNVRDLHQITSEKSVETDADPEGRQYWRKRILPQEQVDNVLPLDRDHWVLGLSNRALEGSIQLFDKTGKLVAMLQNPACGFVGAGLSSDQQVGVAVCDRTGLDEAHFGETLRREAFVFEIETLKVMATIPMSRLSLNENGPSRDDSWVATPAPAVWHAKDRVLVAIPDFRDSINVYSIPVKE
jgi:hypothetical protein